MHNIWTWRRFSPQWKKAIIRIRSLNILCDHLTWWTLSNRVVNPLLAPWEVIHPGVYCPTDAGHSVSVLKDMVTAPPDIKCGQKKEKHFNPVRINNRIQNQTTTLKKKKKRLHIWNAYSNMLITALITHIRATAQVIKSLILRYLSDLFSQPLNHLKYDPINDWSPHHFWEPVLRLHAHTGVVDCNNQYFYSEIPYFSNTELRWATFPSSVFSSFPFL